MAAQQKAYLLVRLQQWKEAEEMGQKVVAISQRLVSLDSTNLDYRNTLARSYQVKGDTMEFAGGDEEVIKWYRLSAEEAQAALSKNPSGETIRRVMAAPAEGAGRFA